MLSIVHQNPESLDRMLSVLSFGDRRILRAKFDCITTGCRAAHQMIDAIDHYLDQHGNSMTRDQRRVFHREVENILRETL